ncbi:MAG: undecaprenyl-diphosphate phosphatase [Pseudobdellovibrionaceae bacterium]
MSYLEIVILAFIEGLTEYLPVSSTGHLIIASAFLGIEDNPFVKSFNIIIQFGAILAVLVLYWRRFLPNLDFYKKIVIAFLPAAVIGLAVKNKIDALLGDVTVVAWALILGGFILIWLDRYEAKRDKSYVPSRKIEDLSWVDCLKLGLIQCFAFVPGVSRSGATIVGGVYLGMSKKDAAEFSFFLAVPTLAGASLIKTLGLVKNIESGQILTLLFGTVLAFLVAMAAIRFFIGLLGKVGFAAFGVYRILLGLILLALLWGGTGLQMH